MPSKAPWELVETTAHFYIIGTQAPGEDFRPFVAQRQKTCYSASEEARIRADMRLITAAPKLLDELDAAHKIILNALTLMTDSQKSEWARTNDLQGLIESGTTRYHERAAALAAATGGAS